MKGLVASVFLLFSAGVFAAEGTTFCPQPKSFKYNASSGQLEAPGGWVVHGDAKTKVVKFKRVEASEYSGKIFACFYDMKMSNQPLEFIATANYAYVADNIENQNWRKGQYFKVCESANPVDCSFHIEN